MKSNKKLFQKGTIKSLFSDFLSILIKSFPVLVGFITTVIIERLLSTENVGVFAQVQILLNFFVLIALFGSDQLLFQQRDKINSLNEHINSSVQFYFLSCILCFIVINFQYGFLVAIAACFTLYMMFSNRITSFFILIKRGYNVSSFKYEIIPSIFIMLGFVFYHYAFKELEFILYAVILLGASRFLGFNKIRPVINLKNFNSLKQYFFISILNFFSLSFELMIISFVISSRDFAILSINHKLTFGLSAIFISLPLKKIINKTKTKSNYTLIELTFIPIFLQFIFLIILYFSYNYIITIWGNHYNSIEILLKLFMISLIYVFNAGFSLKLLDIKKEKIDISSRLLKILIFLIIIFLFKIYSLNLLLVVLLITSFIELITKILMYVKYSYC